MVSFLLAPWKGKAPVSISNWNFIELIQNKEVLKYNTFDKISLHKQIWPVYRKENEEADPSIDLERTLGFLHSYHDGKFLTLLMVR